MLTFSLSCPFTRYVLSFKACNTKWETDSSGTENRVHWSKGNKGWDPYLDQCNTPAGQSPWRTQACVGEAPADSSSFLTPYRVPGLVLAFLFWKCGLWALPFASMGVWSGGEVQGELLEKTLGILLKWLFFTWRYLSKWLKSWKFGTLLKMPLSSSSSVPAPCSVPGLIWLNNISIRSTLSFPGGLSVHCRLLVGGAELHSEGAWCWALSRLMPSSRASWLL